MAGGKRGREDDRNNRRRNNRGEEDSSEDEYAEGAADMDEEALEIDERFMEDQTLDEKRRIRQNYRKLQDDLEREFN
jgi:hypothetical protein